MKKHLIVFQLFFMASFGYSQFEKPNVLFLVIEDTSPYLFPAYGNQSIKTTNLDWMASYGVVFHKAYANAPYCSPARSMLTSGTTGYGLRQ
ncbi:sulfatase-like hydrolase/transferase [Pedobacter arcticus]|uniref:sulfatase-like hydrolase/transferase n=1 Tax=Pedobacter arcticus TaxID=752140 RepID=UPI0002E06D67|nr:sulfatase-like hydrolase/transferase [Pedobacter arcticus]